MGRKKTSAKLRKRVIEFWSENPQSTYWDFYDYLKITLRAGPPRMSALRCRLNKCGLLKVSGTTRRNNGYNNYKVKTWILRDKYVMDREI